MAHNFEVLLVTDSTGQQSNIAAYNLNDGQNIATLKGGTSEANTLCVFQNEYIISSIPNKAVIQVYEMSRKSQQSVKTVLPGVVKCLCISHDGSVLAAGISEKVLVWELAGGELLAIMSRHYQNITCLAFSHDDSYLVSSGEDGIVTVWDMADVWDSECSSQQVSGTLEAYHSWTSHTLPVTSVKFGSRLLVFSASLYHAVKIHDLPTKQTIMTIVLNSGITSLALAAGETSLYAGCSDGFITHINLVNCEHDSTTSGSAMLLNPSKEHQQVIKAHEKAITCLSCSLDDTYIVSGSVDATVKLWDVASHQCMRTIKCSGPITNAIFVFASSYFKSANSKPTMKFPKLAHQISDESGKYKKYFKIGTDGSESEDHKEYLSESVSLGNAGQGSSENMHELALDRNRLIAENEKLYKYALNHILNA